MRGRAKTGGTLVAYESNSNPGEIGFALLLLEARPPVEQGKATWGTSGKVRKDEREKGGSIEMLRNIEAVYEGGVLKPLSPLKLKEREKVRLTLEKEESVVRTTSGMFTGLNDIIIDEIALPPKFLFEKS